MTRLRLAAVLAVTALLVAACGSDTEPDREPLATSALEVVDTSDMWLPSTYEGLTLLDPGWTVPPQQAGGIYLGAGERDGMLEFTAVDRYGDPLWSAQRPISCTGFSITTDVDGRSLAVLSDSQTTSEALAATTVTAYDLTTGEEVWGPVDVPGPHYGPGLVYAAPPAGYMGDTGQRVALDPSTGHAAFTETGSYRIVGEYDGTVLTVDAERLAARDTHTGDELWAIDLDDQGWEQSDVDSSVRPAPPGLALLTTSGDGALIDLADGTLLSDTAAEAELDLNTGTLVVLDAEGLHAHDESGETLWSHSVTDETTIAALGQVFLYLREGREIRVHNVLTGAVAQAYDPAVGGAIVVPEDIPAGGAGLLLDDRRYLLAAVEKIGELTLHDGEQGLD